MDATRNSQLVEYALTPAEREAVRPVLLDMLDARCRSVSRRGNGNAGLSTLLLFKLGHFVFRNDSAIYGYISDLFRLHSRDILKSNSRLNGLLYLSSAYDNVAFPQHIKARLHNIVRELVGRAQ
jgi:hypothetical protein